MALPTTPDELFRRINEYKMRAEIEQRAEDLTVDAITIWLRSFKHSATDELADMLARGEWKNPRV